MDERNNMANVINQDNEKLIEKYEYFVPLYSYKEHY